MSQHQQNQQVMDEQMQQLDPNENRGQDPNDGNEQQDPNENRDEKEGEGEAEREEQERIIDAGLDDVVHVHPNPNLQMEIKENNEQSVKETPAKRFKIVPATIPIMNAPPHQKQQYNQHQHQHQHNVKKRNFSEREQMDPNARVPFNKLPSSAMYENYVPHVFSLQNVHQIESKLKPKPNRFHENKDPLSAFTPEQLKIVDEMMAKNAHNNGLPNRPRKFDTESLTSHFASMSVRGKIEKKSIPEVLVISEPTMELQKEMCEHLKESSTMDGAIFNSILDLHDKNNDPTEFREIVVQMVAIRAQFLLISKSTTLATARWLADKGCLFQSPETIKRLLEFKTSPSKSKKFNIVVIDDQYEDEEVFQDINKNPRLKSNFENKSPAKPNPQARANPSPSPSLSLSPSPSQAQSQVQARFNFNPQAERQAERRQ